MKTKITFLCLLVGSLLALSPTILLAGLTTGPGVADAADSGPVSGIQGLIPGPVPDELVVDFNGLDWVWASPCIHGGCSNPDPANQEGWRYATDEELQNSPACDAFIRVDSSLRCSSPYFDPTFDHCDLINCEQGAVGSAEGQPCINGEIAGHCESFYVRGELVEGAATARFHVTKTFTDESEDEVEVMLTCNTGLPLQQSLTIKGGDPAGVTFVVTEITDGATNCEVTESGGPSGYTTIFNDGDGCAWTGLSTGFYECVISNEAQDGTFTVHKDWNVFNEDEGGSEVLEEAGVTIWCYAEITNGGEHDYYSDDWYLFDSLGDGESLTAKVSTLTGPANCWAYEHVYESGVESTGDCSSRPITAGGSSSCTFTNTVFFEGIPTLSQYGMALMALLMLGVGFVGFRRFA
jgi:hypothetical protein